MITFARRSKIQTTTFADCHMTAAINRTGTDYPAKAPKNSLKFVTIPMKMLFGYLLEARQNILNERRV
jgi:hypothetical protein